MKVLLILFIVGSNGVQDVPEVNMLHLNDEMKTYLDRHVIDIHRPVERMEKLADVVYNDQFLNLAYDLHATRTAEETFETRSGNCLSITAMFVAMARYSGLQCHFQEVVNAPNWSRKGRVVTMELHVNALIKAEGRLYIMDFNEYWEKRDYKARVISDARAHALYYNNLGQKTTSPTPNRSMRSPRTSITPYPFT